MPSEGFIDHAGHLHLGGIDRSQEPSAYEWNSHRCKIITRHADLVMN